MKKVAIVAPQFPPCNLTASHRSRYFASNLHKFGWEPYVVSVEEKHYGKHIEKDLLDLIPGNLKIIKTKAIGVKPFKIIGDLSLRSIYWQYKALCNLVENEKIDLLFIPIPPNYSSILGYLIHKKYGIPYAIDYIDPWVTDIGKSARFLSKTWISHYLARFLEPRVLKNVSLITSVAPLYYKNIEDKYEWLNSCEFESMPYGVDFGEFEVVRNSPKKAYLFDRDDSFFNIIYAGAMLPKAYRILDELLMAIEFINHKNPAIGKKIKLYFVGTGKDPADSNSHSLNSEIEKYNLKEQVIEYPARIPYLDVINHLNAADAVLVMGSTERHYSPSKIFQAVMSKNPILALLHKESTAIQIAKEINARYTVAFEDDFTEGELAPKIYKTILEIVSINYDSDTINWENFKNYSTENMTKILASSFDKIV